jgi:predicted RND superfamily exporter protein
MGIGVAFNIYFVANWRAGETAPLNSSTARAVVLSSLTALTAFGSLALSPHAGTASLGQLLTLCLSYTLLTALVLLPALLARLGPRKH